jgi:hypothetical protein
MCSIIICRENEKNGFGRGRHSHPGGTYKSPGSTGLAHSMDRYVYTICRCYGIGRSESSVIKQSGLWIRRDHTLYIYSVLLADRVEGRVLIVLFISFHFISFHFISFHFVSFHFISFHFMSCHVMSLRVSGQRQKIIYKNLVVAGYA